MSESGVVYTATGATRITTPEKGMMRQVLAWNPHLMLVRHTFEEGWKGVRHSHPHHQMVYVVRGHIRFEAEGRSWEMRAGDSLVVIGGVEHGAAAVEASEVLDIFTPYRQDYA
jgi:quercetin dioxygenase-like cupin family protein